MSDAAAVLEPAALFSTLDPCAGLLLAISGGPDSIALLHLAAAWRKEAQTPPVLAAATVDHGLRPGSAQEAEAVGAWCQSLGVAHKILVWTGDKPTAGIQARARCARYHLLFTHMGDIGAAALVTAHHADDQWETVMMRLARGSGIAGLSGMSRDQAFPGGRLVRPLLHAPKATLVDYCRRHGLAYFDDPSNEDPRFARTGWRQLAPSLHRLGLTRARAALLASRAEKCDRALAWSARRFGADVQISTESNVYDLSSAIDAPQAIVEYFLRDAVFKAAGAPPARLERLESLAGRVLEALQAGAELRATLGGCTVTLNRRRRLKLALEPQRKRGG
ncbi:tRNA(Ile)-lysidine synthase [Rhodoblastus acidophilus]|uniref:tRNA lysidine(34) synthetase TilS n=1 Tax=Rhodoblastus acidophilus TaxID=1074 RepID=UPI0022241DCF|nr:tRNA lysidine(34) synthetase TilS [Rhodoblastus acidophilus]MCW2315015.1 tRNA(Ile)-lysidine synthase [Rhodoblastus acidophilus]